MSNTYHKVGYKRRKDGSLVGKTCTLHEQKDRRKDGGILFNIARMDPSRPAQQQMTPRVITGRHKAWIPTLVISDEGRRSGRNKKVS